MVAAQVGIGLLERLEIVAHPRQPDVIECSPRHVLAEVDPGEGVCAELVRHAAHHFLSFGPEDAG